MANVIERALSDEMCKRNLNSSLSEYDNLKRYLVIMTLQAKDTLFEMMLLIKNGINLGALSMEGKANGIVLQIQAWKLQRCQRGSVKSYTLNQKTHFVDYEHNWKSTAQFNLNPLLLTMQLSVLTAMSRTAKLLKIRVYFKTAVKLLPPMS